eukprot:CAMPEP_0197460736 /NCGR_PEP_ID=MMETSP1175-20131217/54769_1 /TAXON_ID=1003142 /ORGANISM="Triceratium dubium, Strain CCMP147" /LENGTH=535 /DNA_ID=CAMNT_0042995885 /DNA_START=45 /DNA_END=1652 /DNA_ORIENTATION=-
MTFTSCVCCTNIDAVEHGGAEDGKDSTGEVAVEQESASKTAESATKKSVGNNRETVYYSAVSSFSPLILRSGVSLDDPASVLRQSSTIEAPKVGESLQPPEDDRSPQLTPPNSSQRPQKTRKSGNNFLSSVGFRRKLEETPKVVDTPQGYPGHLTPAQLDACLEFRRRLKDGDQVYRDMVGCFSDVEEEAYAICRYMRARKFDVDRTFQMMEEKVELWKSGAAHSFFPVAADAIGGAPESALLTQFPLIVGGTARNGCPVVYLNVRQLRIEGIECVASLDDIPNYMWHLAIHKLKHHVAAVVAKDPSRFVRTQLMVAVDLLGLPMGTLSSAMGALQNALQILSVFPEFLFNVVIFNAPRFFASFWPVIKAFLEPETAAKFELYASGDKGKARLLELIDESELASDFGGNAPSSEMEIAKEGEDGRKVSRRVVELLKVHKRHEGVCNIHLAENETVSITVYTKAHDGANIKLFEEGKSEPYSSSSMTRSNEKAAGCAFFKRIASSKRGPQKYRLEVNRHSAPPAEHFLVIADICES